MSTKLMRFIKRASRQGAFYTLVQLFCYFGIRKKLAFQFAVTILETFRFQDRWKRKAILKRIAQPKLEVSHQTASVRSNSNAVEGLGTLCRATMAVVERNREFIEENRRSMIADCLAKKTAPNLDLLRVRMRNNRYEMENVEDFREVFSALAHPDLFSITANYLGGAPVLMSVSLVYTPQNNSLLGSQFFHAHSSFDYNKPKEIGIVMNMTDVSPECGPFSYVPADLGLPVILDKSLWRGSRISDENLFSKIDADSIDQLTGGIGETLFTDGSRCIHQGARATGGSRTVLIAFYSLPHIHGLPRKSMLAMANKSALAPKNEFESLLLRV